MNVDSSQFKKLFTVDEANAALPLVRAICSDLSALSCDVIERHERLSHLLEGRGGDRRESQPSDVYSEELEQIEQELEKDNRRLRGYAEELRELGVEPKNGSEGLADFPSLVDGRVVFLCWKLDEPEVLFWHELDAGFAGRQSLTADSATGGDSLTGGDPLTGGEFGRGEGL